MRHAEKGESVWEKPQLIEMISGCLKIQELAKISKLLLYATLQGKNVYFSLVAFSGVAQVIRNKSTHICTSVSASLYLFIKPSVMRIIENNSTALHICIKVL